MPTPSAPLIVRHATAILFAITALCFAGGYAALHMPSSVFPETDFPRIIILADNGVMPADEMMATVTRPIEEAMKSIPGTKSVRSRTGRGDAEIDLFFNWNSDMRQSELYTLNRLAQIGPSLPEGVKTDVHRMTFSAFPVIGLSFTQTSNRGLMRDSHDLTALWETLQYEVKPRLIRLPGVAAVEISGGPPPEYQVVVDPVRLTGAHLAFTDIQDALQHNNLVVPTGMHDEDHRWFLTVVDGRFRSVSDIENLPLPLVNSKQIRLADVATVTRAAEPVFQRVTADGQPAVLVNIFAQQNASTLDIAQSLKKELPGITTLLPNDAKIACFYDQSQFITAAENSVWEAIAFGLLLTAIILYLFLRDWTATMIAMAVIPVTVLMTSLAMKIVGLSFNLMTLGGIAASIGLIIDDAIVVVESIFVQRALGMPRLLAVRSGLSAVLTPLLGSTFTPVVVFIPLAFLDGISGVFFRALAITMVVGLLTSLLLALTLTPLLASIAGTEESNASKPPANPDGGRVLQSVVNLYEQTVRAALNKPRTVAALCLLLLVISAMLYRRLKSDFLPAMDEGGFVIDYIAPTGTSLDETNRQMQQAEQILSRIPEIECYSRRTGAALGVHLVEPNTGDFLVRLKPDRKRSSDQVISDVRRQLRSALPDIDWDFPGILTDLVGDLISWSDSPVEVKLFSNQTDFLNQRAADIQAVIGTVPGVVDTNGTLFTGPSICLRVRLPDARHFGFTTASIADAVRSAMLGKNASYMLEGDRTINIRLTARPSATAHVAELRELPLRSPTGALVQLHQLADIIEQPSQPELQRDDFRQVATVTARLQNRDLGSAMRDIQATVGALPGIPAGSVEYGGLYELQENSFRNLSIVLLIALALVFAIAVVEFRSLVAPVAIVSGAVLAVLGMVIALLLTGTAVSIVVYLGAIIGMGIVHKNGILMLDSAEQLILQQISLKESLIQAGRRRLRPVLMTSLAAALGMLPLALGIGSAADMLKPLAITIIGAVGMSVFMSLVATPTIYYLLHFWRSRKPGSTGEM